MVDSINNNSINDLQANQLAGNQQVASANLAAASANKQNNLAQLIDLADISDTAKAKLKAEQATMQFVRELNQQEEAFDTEKVALFKNMLDSGKINQYLSNLGNDTLADSLLNSPMKAAFQ